MITFQINILKKYLRTSLNCFVNNEIFNFKGLQAYSLNEAPEYEKFFDIIDGLNEDTEEENQIKEPITKMKDSTYKTYNMRLIHYRSIDFI